VLPLTKMQYLKELPRGAFVRMTRITEIRENCYKEHDIHHLWNEKLIICGNCSAKIEEALFQTELRIKDLEEVREKLVNNREGWRKAIKEHIEGFDEANRGWDNCNSLIITELTAEIEALTKKINDLKAQQQEVKE